MTSDKKAKELARLAKLKDLWKDPHPGETGVLLSDQIKYYADEGNMIVPFTSENVKPAGYELTVGDEAMRGGEHIFLKGVDSELNIPPFEVAVVKTGETINLPRFIIARWNIRVRWAYKGLLWVGGPQVDPGYVGHLFCPLYNLSSEPVKLKKGEPIALMDFVKTTSVDTETLADTKLETYRRPPKRILLEDYGVEEFKSALFSQDREVKEGLSDVRRKVELFTSFTFVVVAVLMSLIALPYLSDDSLRAGRTLSDAITLGVAFFALLLSIFCWRLASAGKSVGKARRRRWITWWRHEWWAPVLAALLSLLIGALLFVSSSLECCCLLC